MAVLQSHAPCQSFWIQGGTSSASHCKYPLSFICERLDFCSLISVKLIFSPTFPAEQTSSFLLLLFLFLKGSFALCFHWSQPDFREFPFHPALPASPMQKCLLLGPVFPFLVQELSLFLRLN